MLFDIRHVSNEGAPSHREFGLDYDLPLQATLAKENFESIFELRNKLYELGFEISGGSEVKKLEGMSLEDDLRGEIIAVGQIYLNRDGKRYGTLELGFTRMGINHLIDALKTEQEPLSDAAIFVMATIMREKIKRVEKSISGRIRANL